MSEPFFFLQVIAINGKFPGPTINVTTNNNVMVNVRNKLDESLLIHWYKTELYYVNMVTKEYGVKH